MNAAQRRQTDVFTSKKLGGNQLLFPEHGLHPLQGGAGAKELPGDGAQSTCRGRRPLQSPAQAEAQESSPGRPDSRPGKDGSRPSETQTAENRLNNY